MQPLQDVAHLWLPILLSAAAVWVASAVGWMFINHHAKDWGPLPDEDRNWDVIRSMGLKPGCYGFPHVEKSQCSSPEAKAKWERGPMGMLRIWRNPNMSANMIASFAVYLIISILIAYLCTVALPWGTSFAKIMQVAGTAGILAYVFGGIPGDIWFQQSRRAMTMCIIDGVIFGLITGVIFAWLWPDTAFVVRPS